MRFGFEKPTKNLPKTYPKRGPSDEKIDAKNKMLFNIDVFTFWPRFWSLLGLQLGAKLVKNRNFDEGYPPPLSDLKLDVF